MIDKNVYDLIYHQYRKQICRHWPWFMTSETVMMFEINLLIQARVIIKTHFAKNHDSDLATNQEWSWVIHTLSLERIFWFRLEISLWNTYNFSSNLTFSKPKWTEVFVVIHICQVWKQFIHCSWSMQKQISYTEAIGKLSRPVTLTF